MLTQKLENLGFSKRESLCYVALLEYGSLKASILSKKTGIPSSKIYAILERLIERGLISYVICERAKHFQVTDPNLLLSELDEKRQQLSLLLPDLLTKQHFSKKQSVELYEGQKAIFSLFTSLITDAKPKEQYLVYSINEEFKNKQSDLFFKNLAVRRKEKKLDVRLLRNIAFYKNEKHTKLRLRYTSLNLPQGITIFRDTVILISWQSLPTAIRIESPFFSSQQRAFFLDLWERAKN